MTLSQMNRTSLIWPFIYFYSCLAVRKPIDAAAVLARRSDCQALKAATRITLFAGEMSSFKYYATRFIEECLTVGDWSSAAEVLEWDTSLKVNIDEIKAMRKHFNFQ